MALALLARQWASEHGSRITALIVDHGLRDESADQAQQTLHWLAQHNISAYILSLSLARGEPAIQERARIARYDALTNWCRTHQIRHLLLGHHADDQAETVLFRLARGSGLAGLSGMSALREIQGVTLVRPLLTITKAALIRHLESLEQCWIDDPSNTHPAYARTAMRQLLAAHASLNATGRLCRIASALGRYRAQEEEWLNALLARHVVLLPGGIAQLSADFMDVHPLDQADMLMRILTAVDGRAGAPRSADIARLVAALPAGCTESLHRCLIIPHSQGGWLICREPANVAATQPLGYAMQWDHRFAIDYTGPLHCHIASLGEAGRLAIKQQVVTDLPVQAIQSLPAIWHLDAPQAVPHIGYHAPGWNPEWVTIQFSPAKPLADAPFYAMNNDPDILR